MDKVLGFFIIIGAFSGFSKGAGILPDGPLDAAIGGSVLFETTKTPPETLFASVSWTFGGITIGVSTPSGENITTEYEGRARIFHSNGSLELSRLTAADSGEYGVTILPGTADPPESGNITLEVYAPVSNVTLNPETVNLVEFSGSLKLYCSSSGSNLSFIWSIARPLSKRSISVTDGVSLYMVDNVTRADYGRYNCHVFNRVSQANSNTATVTIYYGPEEIKLIELKTNKYVTGSDISLYCSADSSPSAQFTWFLNGFQLPHFGSKLKLRDVRQDQSGNYSCRAFNDETRKYQTSEPLGINILEPSNGCGAGCIAGIVIGCLIVVAGLVLGGYSFYQRKKNINHRAKSDDSDEEEEPHYENISTVK